MLAHMQFGVHRDPQVLFYKAIFQLNSLQHILVPEVVLPQVQDLEFVCLADDLARERRPVLVTTAYELQLKRKENRNVCFLFSMRHIVVISI